MREYLFAALLALAGCAEIKTQIELSSEKYDKPKPFVNIRPREGIWLTLNSSVALTVEDRAENRVVYAAVMYFIPEGKGRIELETTGSVRELQDTGKSYFCWHARKQFEKLPEGPGTFVLEIIGREKSTYEVPITIKKNPFQ